MEEGLPAWAATLISVLSGGVAAAFVSTFGAHRTAMRSQLASERAGALLRAMHLIAIVGNDVQDEIFNHVEARIPNWHPTMTDRGPYDPHPRELRGSGPVERTEIEALVTAYGTDELLTAHAAWERALASVEDQQLTVDVKLSESHNEDLPTARDFSPSQLDEQNARELLSAMIRSILREGRDRHRYRPRRRRSAT